MRWLKYTDPVKYAKQIGVKLGQDVYIARSVCFDSEPYLIEVGDKTKLSNDVRFVTHDGGIYVIRNLYTDEEQADIFGRITIGKNCFIGNHAVIMPNITIGDNVIVGYGSLVTKDIPSNEVWAGFPAKKIESLEEYYLKNKSLILKTKNLDFKNKKDFLTRYYKIMEKK